MARTSSILARRHDGKWEILASPDMPITEQQQMVRGKLGVRSHPDFNLIVHQESDGIARRFVFLSPKEHDVREKSLADQHQAFEDNAAASKKAAQISQDEIDDRQRKAHVEQVSEHSRNIEKTKSAQTKNKK